MAKEKIQKKWIMIGAVALVILIVAGLFIGTYNNFVTLNQAVKSDWSEVENQYQRQADLIPNLVSVVSSAVSVETKFVKDVVDARTNWNSATSELAKDTAGVQMNSGISALISAVAENYPVLQANNNYVALQDELTGTQNRIATSRGRYIEAIQAFNTAVQRFPGVMFAGLYGFSVMEYYQANPASIGTPQLGTGTLP